MSDHWDRIARLSPEKRALLTIQLQKRSVSAAPPLIVPHSNGSKPTALSFAQQRLWFLDQLEPGKSVYNLADAIRLTGLVDVEALTQSFNEIVQRHEALRTTFREIEGEPFQIIAPSLVIPVQVEDLSGLTKEDRESEVARLAAEEAQVPFDLIRGPLLRIRLLKLDDLDHVLLFTMHHIISDGWSIGVLTKELSLLYEAFSEKKPSPLSDLPIQYADFARWQRDWLQGEQFEKLLSYWTSQLTGAPAVIDLPSDRPRPREQSSRGAKQSLRLSEQLSRALTDLSQTSGATLFMILLAAFKTLLYRYTGVEDVVVGIPISGRNQTETRELIGLFVNTLALRTRLSGKLTFRELLEHVRETSLGAYDHADLPFETLTERLRPQRSLSHTPLFQVMFVFQNAPNESLSLRNISLTPLGVDTGAALYDLTLTAIDADGKLKISLEYNLDLFDHSTSRRMLENLQRLLEGITANPDQRLSELPLLTEAEKQRLLVDLNHVPDADPPVLCVHQLFEEQAARTPDAVALRFEGQSLSYAELNARANQLARFLQAARVGPEVLVGIYLERSFEMIIAMLAVLKAGGAYVPLATEHPAQRLAQILDDAQVKLVLTTDRMLENVTANKCQAICLDREWSLIAEQSDSDLPCQADPANAAYVIYTSGSTGRPKGVLIQQASIAAFSLGAAKIYSFRPGDRVLQFASIAFDTSAEEIYTCLATGACLVLRTEEMLISPSLFLERCREWDVTVLDLPTAYWDELVANAAAEDWSRVCNLRLVIIGSEKAKAERARDWSRHANGIRLINSYGPTEATVVATSFELPSIWDSLGEVPIGRPVYNAQCYVLDEELQLVPVGVTGELYIGGSGLARGYLNRPDLTAEKFIPDHFSQRTGARLYSTGDRVKYLENGNLEFIGRVDNQVKLRGFRIELADIEAVLSSHPGVRRAALLMHDRSATGSQLVAYVERGEEQPSAERLREHLKERLPQYMVPSVFVMLDQLPLTPSGKIDRPALPDPEISQVEAAEEYEAARTPVEELVASAFAEILGIERAGVHDNFFDLGGHSLLATRVVSRLRKATQRDLPLRLIFDAPTVAGLADRIDAQLRTNPSGSLTPIKRPDRTRDLPLSFAQQRLWFLDQMEPGSPSYNMHVALRLTGPLDIAVLDRSLAEIIRRHESLRTNFPTVEGHPVQVVHPALDWHLKVVNLESLDESQREAAAMKLIADEARQPFDLSDGSLLRGILLKLDAQQQMLMLTMHHIISDAWSISVLVREALALYKAFSAGLPSPLPELEIQYADFALWQRDWLQGETLEKELSYWRDRLRSAVACIDLPTDRPRPAVQTYRGAAHTFTIPGELADAIRRLSRREGATLFIVLLAAFKVLLHRYSGQNDILVGTPIANRDRAEIENLIGFFLNTLVLRTDVSPSSTFKQLLAQVREVAVGAYAHQGLPFEKILEELQPERNLSHTPLFQVWFNLLNAELDNIVDSLPDTKVELVSAPIDQSKFDLSLRAAEQTGGLRLQFIYNSDLFDASTITAMAGHFRNLLEAVAADPDQRIAAIPLLSDSELHEIRNQQRSIPRSKSFAEFAREAIEQSIPDRFAMQVRQYPNRTAVKTPNYEWTYLELKARSDAVAQTTLRLLGPASERVALLMERDAPMVAGILGALRAGKTYVPLDPYYPAERNAYMLEDSEAAAILTNNKNLSFAQALAKDHVRIINLDDRGAADVVGHSTLPVVAPDCFAYILYTSGTTGRPKGVIQNHRNVLHFIRNYTNNLGIGPEDKLSLLSSYCFDAAIMDIFGALLNGAELLPFDLRQDGLARFTDWIIEQGITIYHSTPTVYRYLLRSLSGREQFPSLRLVVLGGEAVYKRDVEEYQRRFGPQCLFVNGLGPTESTLGLQFVINKNTRLNRNAVPVGYAVEDTQILLLDDAGVPGAIRGEIGIRSKHLALGYWKQEELTRRAFLPDPHGDGLRTYKTGDIGRLLPEGALEFIGRNDTQIKIRGYRVEIAEIEALLAEHDSVKDAVVTASEEQPGEQPGEPGEHCLAAYIVNQDGCEVSVQELQEYLKDRLPDYMVPAVLIRVNEIPLTPSGKVDRTRLPVPEFTRPDDDEDVLAPCTPVQQVLETIWTELLQIERAGLYDNFFALGGHSLLAAQVVARIKDVFSIDLPLRAIFENSTLIGLSRLIESKISQADTSTLPTIKRAPRDEPLPLSFPQRRLWFLEQLEPGASVYNIPFAATLTGKLDRTSLERAFGEIVRRHEVLRTTFVEIAGKPAQHVKEISEIGVSVADLTGLDESNKETEALQIIKQESELPFDLSTGPLMRVKLIRLAEQQHILVVVMHHIISDAWSKGVLIKELAAIYEAYCRGEESPLEQPQLQYGDYAVWQRDWLKTEVLHQQLRYWKENLGQEFPALELPTDRTRPAIQSHAGAQERLELSGDLSYELREASRREGITLFMLFVGAFQVLLHRYSGQDEILVGTTTANRRDALLEEMIGFFANTLVLRADLSGDPTFREFLRQVRETALNAYAHQDIPFEMLVEELQPERDMSRNPVFQTMVILQNTPLPRLELSELTLSAMRIENSTAKFDLLLALAETEKGLTVSVEYNSELFASGTILRMLSHFETLLRSILRNPGQRVSQLDYITDAERTELLYKWTGYQEFPHVPCIHRLFEQQAEQTPEATAVTFNGSVLEYGELNKRANKLAHYLRRLGVGPDVLVGIVTERSPEMIIGLLGILKAGGAYVPIDPAYPYQRIAFMLEDANITVLLTQRSLIESLPESQAAVVCIDSDWERIAQETEENPNSDVFEENLAYVIYTSGSTGKPKGVLVTHANVVRLLTATKAWFKFDSSDVWTLFHSYAFDFSVWEMWGALVYGGRLVIVPYLVSRSPQAVHQLLSDEGVTILNQTPSAFHQLMKVDQAAPQVDFPALRFVIFGGEALDIRSLTPWFERHGDKPRLVNMYGITETTVHVTLRPLSREDFEVGRTSIGVPISDMQYYMLDRHLQPTPLNVAAEIYVGGPGVSRGYLNRPDMTAERFIPDPFGLQPGRRLYKTGDLARWLGNGDVEYLGRIDQQVKIRGFRIELAEIESALGQHPQVKECAVVMGQGANRDRSLLAYVVPYPQRDVTTGDLRTFLKQTLPEYMIPSQFLTLEEMPLTSNGKLDRKGLPAPRQSRGDLGSDHVAPRNLIEQAMIEIWSQVLDVERVGVHDNFFAIGGHSLLATQLLSRLRHVLKVEVSLRNLYEFPTISELAQIIERGLQSDQSQEITEIQRASREGPLPLSFAQERLWFLDQFEPGSSFYSIPIALRLTGSLNIDALQFALNEVERRHESLRTVFASSQGKPFQRVLEPRGVEVQVAELGEIAEPDSGRRIQEAILREAHRGFNLALGPLMRVSLIRLSDREHLLLIVMHHIICDAWSIGLLVRELSSLYRSHLAGERPELEELPVQYGDYALWQREWLQGEVLEQQLDYWKQKLDGRPAVLELPSDRPRPAIQSYRGARVRQDISAEVTSDLRSMSGEAGATLFMLLLAAFEVLLYRYTDKEDICVGTPIAGRNRFETESVVGLFVNTLVMRVDLCGEPSFSELVGRVRDVVIGAFTNQDVPFEKLVEELNPERSMSHSPLFQVMFALQNVETPIPHLPDLRLDPLPCDTATSKFDLGLDVYDGQQGLVCTFEYNTDLFDASTIKRLASHYKTLLEAIVADPNRRISDLPLLSESEQQQLVSGWNDTERDYAHQLCVNELFEAQAQANPDDVAVAFENLTITYGELNRRSNQVAHFLRELGVGPDILVGIYLERSIDVLIAVFGVLKAGGAYVPLDAAYPKERIVLLVEDSELTIVVTQLCLSAQLPPFVQHAVCLDRDWQTISSYSHDSPPQVASPDNLAYAVYTSGSTGKPKGVMISHRSLVNAFQAWRESYRLGSDCKSHLQMASISFDVFAGDLVRALCSGGTLILCPREFLLEPEKLYELMLQRRVDTAEFVPAVVRQLVGYVAERGLSLEFMKLLVVGSDIWNVWEFEHLKSYCGDITRVINSYGVSEATVDSSYFESTQIQLSPGGLVPIGRPFGNTTLHVLDSKFRLAPVGVAGELCIGGLGLARGYLNQPDLTAEKFVANPFSKNAGSRLYRTGDCVRRLADGTIEFLGRLDNQIKIRGFRIELGEIEAALSEHAGVQEAVVMAREAGPGNRILVAYIVPEPGRSTGAAELRRFLKESLPEHMIPSAFVEMERLPLSANGKLDRRALPAPGAVRPDLEQSFVAPRNNIEETINAIWVEVLKIDRIGVNDSFFDLGGHSLLATQVASRLRKAFEIDIPLRSLFENQTIAELGQTVDAVIRNGQHGELKSITPEPRDKPLQLSFAQERLWFLNRLQPGTPFYNSPTAVRLFGTLDIQALERSLEEVARRHEVLRTSFPTVDGRPTLLISPAQTMSLSVIDINGVPALERETRARQLINEEVMRPFDLERGPLWRAALLRFAKQDHVLVFTTHHIVSDAWSMDVLVREAVTLYECFSNNRPSPLADLAIQYTDFSAWQREWMRGEVLDAHLDYWKKKLSGAPPQLRLPTDRSRSSVQNHRGKRLTLPLSRSLIGPLKELTRQSGTTLFMGLLAAFKTLLYRYSGQDDIVVGTAIAGRGRAEIEGLIGFFINMLVMRTSLAGAPRFLDLLSRVKETALGAYAHQDLPFEKLVEVLQPQRDSGGSPLFQVAFGLQNTPAPHVQLPDLEVKPVGFDEHTVRYDLTLWVWELTDGMTAAWTYSTDLFDESTIIRMHQHYDALLLNIVANPEERVNALEMFTELEKNQRAVAERQSHDLKLESLRTSRRTAIEISAEPV